MNRIADILARSTVLGVAAELGLSPGKGLRPTFACPACGRTTRHAKIDKRGPCGVTADGRGWHCHGCHAHGDAVDLVAYQAGERRFRDLGADHRAEVFRWCAARGYCEPIDRQGQPVALRPIAPPRPPAPPRRPPADELRALLRGCVPVDRDGAVAAYLRKRGLDPKLVISRRLATALPPRSRPPAWAGSPKASWIRTGHRIVFGLFDTAGELQSIHARSIDPRSQRKALSPSGFEITGLVFADAAGRTLLGGHATLTEVWIAEGPIDFLAIGTSDLCRRARPALFGILNGSWSTAAAARIPDGANVRLFCDDDAAGEAYCRQIRATLAHRSVQVLREAPPQPPGHTGKPLDWSDALFGGRPLVLPSGVPLSAEHAPSGERHPPVP
jgi:hypothetical protein